MRHDISFIITISAVLILFAGCNYFNRNRTSRKVAKEIVSEKVDTSEQKTDWVTETIEAIRADTTSMIERARNLSDAIGIKVNCKDPVTYIYDSEAGGRRFHWNNVYGDILEIPADWIPSISIYGLSFSYHGAPICSPDSTCWLNPYAWYSAVYVTEEEFYEGVKERYEASSLTFYKREPRYFTLPEGRTIKICWAEGISKDGCRRERYFWNVQYSEGDSPVDYELTYRVLPETPESTKKELLSYYKAYPFLENETTTITGKDKKTNYQ